MFGGTIAFVVKKIIIRIFLVVIFHKFIPVNLGTNGSGSDGKTFLVSIYDGSGVGKVKLIVAVD